MDPAAGTIASPARAAGDEATRPQEPVETTAADKVAYTFYGVAATAALVGQVWAGVKHIPWPAGIPVALQIALVTPAVGVIELGGVATSALADVRRRKGENAYAYRAMSLAAALVALAFNVIGHWSPGERFLAFGFGGLSVFAYVLWIIHSGARRRDALRATGHMDQTAPVYGIVRWLREPRVTYRARQLALEHGYGLYESVRTAERELRTETRNKAIAQVVSETIKDQHKDRPLHAKIAETAYDLDAVAAEISNIVDNPRMAHHIARVLEPPTDHHDADLPDASPAQLEPGSEPDRAPGQPDPVADPGLDVPDASAEAGAELLQELTEMLRSFKAERGMTASAESAADGDLSGELSGQVSGQEEPRPDTTDDPEPPDEPGPGTPNPPGHSPGADVSDDRTRGASDPVSAGQPESVGARAAHAQSSVPPTVRPAGQGSTDDQGLADNEASSDTETTAPDPGFSAPPAEQTAPERPGNGQPNTHPATRSGQSDYWTVAQPAMDAWAASGQEVNAPRLTQELGIPDRTARRMVNKWEKLEAEKHRRSDDNVYPLTGQR